MDKDRLLQQAERVIEERVRPALGRHNGGISIIGLSDGGVLKVAFQGQCRGCPSAGLTLESIVDKEVTHAVPEIREVVLVTDVSGELWETARGILRRKHGGAG